MKSILLAVTAALAFSACSNGGSTPPVAPTFNSAAIVVSPSNSISVTPGVVSNVTVSEVGYNGIFHVQPVISNLSCFGGISGSAAGTSFLVTASSNPSCVGAVAEFDFYDSNNVYSNTVTFTVN